MGKKYSERDLQQAPGCGVREGAGLQVQHERMFGVDVCGLARTSTTEEVKEEEQI